VEVAASVGRASATHGRTGTTEFTIWSDIKKRCLNSNHAAYNNYGGRGIKICDQWRDSFEAFFADMGQRPSLDHSIDRKDNDGNYEPDNCRWATRAEQAANKRNNLIVTAFGKTAHLASFLPVKGGSPEYCRVWCRIKRGMSAQDAILEVFPDAAVSA
jgi:hypothetical protein